MTHPVLRHRNFSLLVLARFLTSIATFTQSVAIGWQVYSVARLTNGVEHSAFLVGMVGLAQFGPLFLLALLAGDLADRHDRRRIMIACSALQMLCSVAFALTALQEQPDLSVLFMIAVAFGVARAFLGPSMMSLAPTLVPPEVLPRAIPWNTLAVQGGMILGPWLGGMLCASSAFHAYQLSGTLYLAAMLVGIFLLLQPIKRRGERSTGSRLTMIREGIAYLRTNRVVLGAISLDLFAVLLGSATALLPVYARDVLHVGPEGFGMLRSASAVGAGTVTLWLGFRPLQRKVGLWMMGSVVVFGVATILFGLSTNMWFSMGMLALLGGADSISVYVRQSLVQILTPDPMLGRVTAISGLFISASNDLGEFESGVVARFLGPVGAVLFGGVGALVITILWAKWFPELRQADRLAKPEGGKV